MATDVTYTGDLIMVCCGYDCLKEGVTFLLPTKNQFGFIPLCQECLESRWGIDDFLVKLKNPEYDDTKKVRYFPRETASRYWPGSVSRKEFEDYNIVQMDAPGLEESSTGTKTE